MKSRLSRSYQHVKKGKSLVTKEELAYSTREYQRNLQGTGWQWQQAICWCKRGNKAVLMEPEELIKR